MGNGWLMLIAPAAVLGAWLFMTVNDGHQAKQDAMHVEAQRDRAEFDAAFAKSWDGKPSPVLEKRAADLSAAVVQAQEAQASAAKAAKEAQEREKRDLEAMLRGGDK